MAGTRDVSGWRSRFPELPSSAGSAISCIFTESEIGDRPRFLQSLFSNTHIASALINVCRHMANHPDSEFPGLRFLFNRETD